jgi:hypothetical protein
VQNLGSRDISQAGPFGDLSDDILIAQQFKIIADLFRISYFYPLWPVPVKPKLKEPIPFPPPLNGAG